MKQTLQYIFNHRIIVMIMAIIVGVVLISSCQAESPAPASIEGTWMGFNSEGNSIRVTFTDGTKDSEGFNSKICISIPDLMIYTSGSYSYSDGYASIAYRNTLSASSPEFYATMVYDGTSGFTMRIDAFDGTFNMTKQ